MVTNVTIDTGTTLTVIGDSPLIWFVTKNVTINGQLVISGKPGQDGTFFGGALIDQLGNATGFGTPGACGGTGGPGGNAAMKTSGNIPLSGISGLGIGFGIPGGGSPTGHARSYYADGRNSAPSGSPFWYGNSISAGSGLFGLNGHPVTTDAATSGGGGGCGTAGTQAQNVNSSTGGAGGRVIDTQNIQNLAGGAGGGGGGGAITSGGTGGGAAGGGGGGYFEIICERTVYLNGTILANGGNGGSVQATDGGAGGAGAGGQIKIRCNKIAYGSGSKLEAIGGIGGNSPVSGPGGNGGNGRIRIESELDEGTIDAQPNASVGTGLKFGGDYNTLNFTESHSKWIDTGSADSLFTNIEILCSLPQQTQLYFQFRVAQVGADGQPDLFTSQLTAITEIQSTQTQLTLKDITNDANSLLKKSERC